MAKNTYSTPSTNACTSPKVPCTTSGCPGCCSPFQNTNGVCSDGTTPAANSSNGNSDKSGQTGWCNAQGAGLVACTTTGCTGCCTTLQNSIGACADGTLPATATEIHDVEAPPAGVTTQMEQIFAMSSQLYKYGDQDWRFLTDDDEEAAPPTGTETPNLDAVYYLDDVSSWSDITLPSYVQFSMLEDIEGSNTLTDNVDKTLRDKGAFVNDALDTGPLGFVSTFGSDPHGTTGYCNGLCGVESLGTAVAEAANLSWAYTPCSDAYNTDPTSGVFPAGGGRDMNSNHIDEAEFSVKCPTTAPVRDCKVAGTITHENNDYTLTGYEAFCRPAYPGETFSLNPVDGRPVVTNDPDIYGSGEVAYTEGTRTGDQLDFIADDADSIFLGYWWEEADPQYTDYADGNGYAKRVFAVENEDLGITIEYIDEENLNVTHKPLEISGLRRKSGAPQGEVLSPSSLLTDVANYFYPLMTLDTLIVEKQVLYNKVSQEAIKGRNLFNILPPAESEMTVLQQHTGSFNTQANIASNSNTENTY